MSNPSNLYAEKIYSEHPTVLWALDDKADYVSLITEAQRDVYEEWSASSGGSSSMSTPADAPFQESTTSLVYSNVPVSSTNEAVFISPDLFNLQALNADLNTFSIGTYFYSNSAYLKSISIGYEYTDLATSEIVQHLKTYETDIFGRWSFISETFDLLDENAEFRIVIKIVTNSGGDNINDYQFYLNGISAGQWSEEFNAVSLGITQILLPSSIALDQTYALEAKAYGLSDNSGYYLVKDNALVATNTTIPLVFGASGITKLKPNSNIGSGLDDSVPSLIVPGQGFLNESGRYKDYTVEFWSRISCDSLVSKKIFGPIASSDGLYADSGFLTLKIGESFKSYFVGEWFRPMLIQIRLIKNSASLILNGEQVISITFNTSELNLPAVLSQNNKDQDWLGFYSTPDTNPIEVDCVAIYPYQVPILVAKRRWVYGQGVISPEGINSAYGGTSAMIDYPFADYTANYSYPDFAEWQQGSFDNLVTTKNALENPKYSLPEIYTGTKTIEELYSANNSLQSSQYNFIKLKPNSGWNSTGAYINFPDLNILGDQTSSFYGVFKISENTSTQILFKIHNSLTKNTFIIKKNQADIAYSLVFNDEEEVFHTIEDFPLNQFISVGVKFDQFANSFGGNISSFFGNKNSLKMYVGGDETTSNTFSGEIYSVGLCSTSNTNEIIDYFNDSGIVNYDDAQYLVDHLASYTLLPTVEYNSFYLDIGISGYWEDYLPLSYFAQYVTDDSGISYYDLDFLQFNIGYPSSATLLEQQLTTEDWKYKDLKNSFSLPIQQTYLQLDNPLYNDYDNYQDLEQNVVSSFRYDTANAVVKSYVTFQYVTEGANAPQSFFTNVEYAQEKRIINIDEYPNWETTKFEVVDNTLIYPTKTIDFNSLAIVFRLEFKSRNIIKNPISLRRLSFCSQAFNNNSFNPVGTKFGLNVFPYTKSGIYYNYKANNPFSIYKESTPHLYMTRSSGIELRGDFDLSVERGISIPINMQLADSYKISAMQLWHRYEGQEFSITPKLFFEVRHKNDTIKFYTVAIGKNGSRARVYAISALTGQVVNGISYYLNGNLVREPVLTIKEWSVLGIAFSSALDFDFFVGSVNLNGQGVFNNISYYQATNLQQVQGAITRPWIKVKNDGVTNLNWQYWLDNYNWNEMLVLSTINLYGVDPSEVYQTYIGTNKIIIDDNEGMTLDADNIKIYKDTGWSSTISTPA
jgi:hypothetical protein